MSFNVVLNSQLSCSRRAVIGLYRQVTRCWFRECLVCILNITQSYSFNCRKPNLWSSCMWSFSSLVKAVPVFPLLRLKHSWEERVTWSPGLCVWCRKTETHSCFLLCSNLKGNHGRHASMEEEGTKCRGQRGREVCLQGHRGVFTCHHGNCSWSSFNELHFLYIIRRKRKNVIWANHFISQHSWIPRA